MNLTPMNTTWNITFTDPEGETHTADIRWTTEQPTENEAALAIRDLVLGNVVFPIDQPRESTNHTVALLEHHGFKITGIEKA